MLSETVVVGGHIDFGQSETMAPDPSLSLTFTEELLGQNESLDLCSDRARSLGCVALWRCTLLRIVFFFAGFGREQEHA